MLNTSRVMVIGLDGATLDLILPWARSGHLPTLSKLMDIGAYSRLRSVWPVVSSAAWTTFMTGVNPGKHGVFDFVYRDPESYRLRPVTRRQIGYPSLWRLLSEQGRRVVVLNVPITYPPESVNGLLVSGLGTPNFKTFTYPPDLGDKLLENGYRVNRQISYPYGNEEAFLADSYEITECMTATTLSLMTDNPWDFLMVVYRDTDDIAHGFWRHMDATHPDHDPERSDVYEDAILHYYGELDKQLATLIEAAGPDTTVFVVSDHGVGPLYKEVYLNEWLRQRGYLVSRSRPFHRRLLGQVGLTRHNVSRLMRTMHLDRAEQLIKDLLGEKIDMLPRNAWGDFCRRIDWSQTRAYSFGYQGQIYINLARREPQGIVEPGYEYEKLRNELCQVLLEWVDPADGEPVVDSVRKKEDIYQGPYLDRAPDLIMSMRDLAYITRQGRELGNQPGSIFGSTRMRESGGHRPNGTLIAAGPDIAQAHGERSAAWLGDVAPTVLHVLGCSIPESADGQVLRTWLVPPSADRPISTHPLDRLSSAASGSSLSDGDEEELLERLSDLGYLG
jgi:predicted AlkP superfamily phosphohydrolase/phosphomutase